MTTLTKIALAAAGLLVALPQGGCESVPALRPRHTVVASTQSATCSKCRINWVKVRRGRRLSGYRLEQEMECPDCRSAVENLFASGKLKHTCKTCGGEVERCKEH